MGSTHRYNQSLAYLAWGTAAFFYFYQYIIRIIPGIVGDDIKRDLLINAEQFGLVGSLYVYAYALVQIPLGLMLDKFGIKKVIIASIITCVIGCFMMSAVDNIELLYYARFITGLGSGAAFLVSIKVVTDLLPEGKRGLLIGATLTIGTLSAIIFSRPVAIVSRYFGWTDTCFYIAMAGFVVLAAAVFLIPNFEGIKSEKNAMIDEKSSNSFIKDFWSVLTNKYVLFYALMSIGAYTPTTVLSDLWGPSFLKVKFSLENTQAASINSILFVGLAVGSLFIPWFFERFRKIDKGIAICSVVMFIAYVTVICLDFYSLFFLVFCLFIIGFSCGSEMLCFTGVVRHIKPKNSGLAIGVVNTFNMLGGGLLQHAVGIMIDNNWDGEIDSAGMRVYSLDNYSNSLVVVAFMICLTFIMALYLRDRK